MKRIVSLMICLALCLGFAFAEQMQLDGEAVIFARGKLGEMLKESKYYATETLGSWDFAKLDPDDLRKAAVVYVSDNNIAMMEYMAPEGQGVIAFVADYLNSQYSSAYAAAAKHFAAAGTDAGVDSDRNMFVWLVYDYHTLLCLIRPDGRWESALVMGDLRARDAFGVDYINSYMESFFIFNADIHMLDALPEEDTPENRAISLSKAAVIAMKDKAALEGITLASYNWDIAKLDPQDVKKTAVVKISDRSLTMMQYMAADFGSVIGFIANYVNSQFDKAYTDGANALIQTGTDETVAADGNLLVFTVYDYHICLTLIRADGSWESGLIMSDWNVLNSFNEDYVRAALGQFYVTDVEILSVK